MAPSCFLLARPPKTADLHGTSRARALGPHYPGLASARALRALALAALGYSMPPRERGWGWSG